MEIKSLRDVMRLKEISTGILAKRTGIFLPGLCLKLWGIMEFTQWEIVRIAGVLELSGTEVAQIFFDA